LGAKRQAQSTPIFVVAVLTQLLVTLSCQSVQKIPKPASLSIAGSTSTAKITSAAVWQLAPSFLNGAHHACDHIPVVRRSECFINKMVRAGAPSAAVQFSRQLLVGGGDFGVMLSFHRIGPVDMAKVIYPLRTNKDATQALLLVNGDPQILDVDDLQRLDRRGLKRSYPNVQVRGGFRSGTMWEEARRRQDGGVTFVIPYWHIPQPNGLQLSPAHFEWNFDPAGKFLGTSFLGGMGPLPI
jgi:hypothetical protein